MKDTEQFVKEVRQRWMGGQACLKCESGWYSGGSWLHGVDKAQCESCGDVVPIQMSKPEILEHLMRHKTTLTCGHHPWMFLVSSQYADGVCLTCRAYKLHEECSKDEE